MTAKLETRTAIKRLISGSVIAGSEEKYFVAVEDGQEIARYPQGTAMDVAQASVDHHNDPTLENLNALLTLEARDGNEDAANLLKRHAS